MMAGDWIKMRSALLSNPKVHTIARLVGECRAASKVLTTGANCPPCEVLSRNALRNVTVTALLLVWSSATEHTSDGVMRCCDLIDIDEIAGIPGFGEAMEHVGWALYDDEKDAIILPNFTEWNTPAKDRTAAERQRRFREKRNGKVTRDSNGREEKRREEKDNTEVLSKNTSDKSDPPADKNQDSELVLGEWNRAMGQACRWTDKRLVAFRQRWKSQFWRDNWQAAVQRAASSSFCRGESGGGWAANFEWFLKPDTVTKLLEGNYDDREAKQKPKLVTFGQQRQQNTLDLLERLKAQDEAAAAAGLFIGHEDGAAK
jgi:hypothetical protein